LRLALSTNKIIVAHVLMAQACTALAYDEHTCHYQTYQWNTQSRQAVNHRAVSRPRSQLTAQEVDAATGCTVCDEDQVEIRFATLKPFKVCRQLAAKIEAALQQIRQQDGKIIDVVAYRVGMTRGDIDHAGNRTQFSNHSYGTALDINTGQNGLYDNCLQFNTNCRLIKGGPWHPEQAGSLTTDSIIVRAFKTQGFKWGGEIAGQQKDFMHFSLTGY
jgi:hypothetical protein